MATEAPTKQNLTFVDSTSEIVSETARFVVPETKTDNSSQNTGSKTSSVNVPFDPSGDGIITELPPLEPDASICARASHYLQRAKLYKEDKFKSLRPWSEFLNRDQFSVPSKLEAFSRIHRNYNYFHSNYVVVVALLSSYILITNLVFLISMALCTAAYYYVRMRTIAGQPVIIGSKELSPTQAYATLVVASLLLFYFTNGSSTIFWLVTGSSVVVFGHAATRHPVDELGAWASLPI